MAVFKYLAAAPGRRSSEVEVEAENPAEALRKLRARGDTVIRFLGEADAGSDNAIFLRRKKKIDVLLFTSELSPLLAAGIPIERALAIIAEGCENEDQRAFVVSLRQGLHEGKKLSAVIRSYGRAFPGFYANLIESGEESGSLAVVTAELERFLKESRETRDFIISGAIYPAVVLAVTVAVSLLMFLVFIPRFARLFEDMGRAMPESMNFLLAVSAFFKWTWWSVPCALFIGWRAARSFFGGNTIERWRSRAVLGIPIVGKLLVRMEVGRFCRTLAILLGNQVEIIHSLRIAVRVIQNQHIRESFDRVEGMLRGGRRLSDALHGNPYLPPGFISKLRVGEETGETGPMLSGIAAQTEADARQRIRRLLNAFEPLIIVVLALVVVVVVISIFMAIMDINSIE